MNRKSILKSPIISGLLAGLLGGMVYVALASHDICPLTCSLFGLSSPWFELLLSTAIGAGFGLFFGRLAMTPGSGLMWGVVYGLLWWIVVPLTLFPLLLGSQPGWTAEIAGAAFSLLLGNLVGHGAVLGLAYPLFKTVLTGGWKLPPTRQVALAFLRALFIGGLAGLVGGLAFGAWMEHVGFFPLIAGLLRSDSPNVGRTLHLIISVVIGGSYGVLFRRDIRGIGSSIAWGVAYGFIWWILGPLTLMPWWLGKGVRWSLAAGQAAFPSLLGHLIYGIFLGVVYAAVSRTWRVLFTESDPLNREHEGPGTRSLRASGMGILASVAGGLAFTVVMIQTGALPTVARLIRLSSPAAGFVVHMAISAVIGGSYGLLFRREAYTYGAGLAWGLVYGMVWWLLGPLTLMPILLGASVQWSLAAALEAYPSLIGHLGYGGTTALVYQFLVLRYDLSLHTNVRRGQTHLWRTQGTPAPALWVLILVMGVMLPLLFAG